MRWYGYLFAGILGLGGYALAAGTGAFGGAEPELVRPVCGATTDDDTPLRSSDDLRKSDALPTRGLVVHHRSGVIGGAARLKCIPTRMVVEDDQQLGPPRTRAYGEEPGLCRDESLQSRSIRLQV